MVQFLSINFFFLDFFNFVGIFKSSRFFVSLCINVLTYMLSWRGQGTLCLLIIPIIVAIIFIICDIALLFWMLLIFESSLLITENCYQSFLFTSECTSDCLKSNIKIYINLQAPRFFYIGTGVSLLSRECFLYI